MKARLLLGALLLIVYSCRAQKNPPNNVSALVGGYESATTYDDVTQEDMVLRDESRAREITIRIRAAKHAPQPMPLVVIVHGGGSVASGFTGLSGWARELAARGYATVNAGHGPNDVPNAFCAALGIAAAECDETSDFSEDGPPSGTMPPSLYDRPVDLSFILDQLGAIESQVGITIDRDKLAALGHSAGSHAVLMKANMLVDFSASVSDVSLADARFKAFAAMSPQGTMRFGIGESSWNTVSSPVLIQTGSHDANEGESARSRLEAFEHLRGPNAYQTYIDSPESKHAFFSLDTLATTKAEKCILSVALAFLDSHIRGEEAATTWLASQNLAGATNGLCTVSSK